MLARFSASFQLMIVSFSYLDSFLIPVSYTHLDVYKRQVRDGDIAHIVFGEKDFDIAASFDIISAQSGQVFGDNAADLSRLNIGNHALKRRAVEIAACITVIPVSYTHLDVYKRQRMGHRHE